MTKLLEYDDFTLEVPYEWEDVTAELAEIEPDMPITINDALDGVGAFQLTPAIYEAGSEPQFDAETLREMLTQFAAARNLGEPVNTELCENPLLILAASFTRDDNYFRIWYATDEKNLVLFTYTCGLNLGELENDAIAKCEAIVRSLRFRTH